MKTKIAVLLTCFNRREMTLSCVRRINSQVNIDDLEIEIFLSDDNSTDGTAQAVNSEFPFVKVLHGNGSL